MALTRAALAAVIVAIGTLVALLNPAPAAATPINDGLYRLTFPGGEPSSFDSPDPRGPYSWVLAMRSGCPPSGCVVTATMVDSPSMTYVFRESGGRYISSHFQGFACDGKKTAGTSTMSFAGSGGSLTGELIESASPCQPISRAFTAVREGDLPPVVNVADPNSV